MDEHYSFTVRYGIKSGDDRSLACHYDDAEVTLNVNLGEVSKQLTFTSRATNTAVNCAVLQTFTGAALQLYHVRTPPGPVPARQHRYLDAATDTESEDEERASRERCTYEHILGRVRSARYT